MVKINYSPKLLSNELQEILYAKPAWVLRNGILLYLIIISFSITAAFFINYPDIIEVKARLGIEKKEITNNSTNNKSPKYYAILFLTQKDFKKVSDGEKVFLKLSSSPFTKFEGELSFISPGITDSGFLVKITFQNGFTIKDNIQINYKSQSLIESELVTTNKKLGHMLMTYIKNLFSN